MINLELKSVCDSEINFVAGIGGHEKMVTMNVSDLPYELQQHIRNMFENTLATLPMDRILEVFNK